MREKDFHLLIEDWCQQYNQVRLHSAICYRPPAPETIMPQRNYGQATLTQQLVQCLGAGQRTAAVSPSPHERLVGTIDDCYD